MIPNNPITALTLASRHQLDIPPLVYSTGQPGEDGFVVIKELDDATFSVPHPISLPASLSPFIVNISLPDSSSLN